MARRRRQLSTGIAVAALAVSAALTGVHLAGAPAAPAAGAAELPGGLAAHLPQLLQSVPGNQGMAEEGPGGAADDAFDARSYPTGTISVAQVDRAKAAFTEAAARVAPGGRELATTWEEAGPSRALYPFTVYRDAFNYVPNEYVAGGRTTAIAISNVCEPLNCRAWITPAGGGVWSTVDILAAEPRWSYLGGPLGINAAGSVTVDANDPTGKTVYVGTGEANICGSGCVAGVGMYRSTDGGFTWEGPLGQEELGGKGIGEIAVKPGEPNTIYAATTTALRGMSSVCCAGITRPVPDAEKWGLYMSEDAGVSWQFIHNGTADPTECTGSQAEFDNAAACSPRGVRHVELDPANPDIVYASAYARGIWRSSDSGETWEQIKESLNSAQTTTRAAIDVTLLDNGDTRMYVHEGNANIDYARLFRSDDVASGDPEFTNLTSPSVADTGYATYNTCGGQCWYDLFVHTPAGHPDMVYTGGSYVYGEVIANKRAVILSTDAGVSGTDMTFDGTDELHPNGIHPDQHDIVTNPNDPYQFFEAGDGGVIRSSGELVDRSEWCDDPLRDLDPTEMERCEQMLSAIPSELRGVNNGLSTLQFLSLSVSPHDSSLLQGGTQDNGTWENKGETTEWINTMIGDGGQSGWDVEDPNFRMHNFFSATTEVNFDSGDIGDWIWTADPIVVDPGTQFYAPVITDPTVSGTMFAGTGVTVYRTTTFGLGDRTLEEAQEICNTWTGTFTEICGDWERLGPNPLTSDFWGDREGGAVAAIERNPKNDRIAWAATTTGRVFITKNVNAEDPADVVWDRIDDNAVEPSRPEAVAPDRFVSSIFPHPDKPNRAWISYSGYDSNTPNSPGHVFKVRYREGIGEATFKARSFDLGDQPVTDLVFHDATNDLYASTDFGVLRNVQGTQSWVQAAEGMPNVEIAGLTIVEGDGILYGASHGLSAWKLTLDE